MPKFQKMEKKAEKSIRFISPHAGLKLAMIPGGWTFDSGNNRVKINGKTLEFRKGIYETDDLAEIEFIRAHDYYKNNKIVEDKAKVKKEEEPAKE